jgi:hypothetical protein
MNGVHDMGGMHGFGPVQPEPNEPPFHSVWEARCLAMNRALGYAKIWVIDESRAVIEKVRGCHVFPDTVAIGQGENPQWLYTLVFESRELWGDSADPKMKISIEAFEPYLEPA